MGSPKYTRKKLFDVENIEAFAKNFKAVRKRYGYTQEELAYLSDITLSQIARIETARINPGISTIFRFAKTMNIPVKEFFEFELV